MNESLRAIVTVAFLAILTVKVLSAGRVSLGPLTGFVFAPIAYIALVGVVSSQGLEMFGGLTRWLLYLVTFVYFSADSAREHIEVFVRWSAYALLASFGLSLLIDQGIYLNGAFRIAGSVGSPIGYASALLICEVAVLYFYMRDKTRLHLLLAVLLVIASFGTGTRSIAVCALTFFVVAWVSSLRTRVGRITVLILLTATATPAVSWLLSTTGVGARLLSANDNSLTYRDFIVSSTLDSLSGWERWFGVGIGRFAYWFEATTGVPNVAPHLEWLWILTEGGIVGAIIYFSCLVFASCRVAAGIRRNSLPVLAGFFILVFLWLQQTALTFANPAFFYQGMIILFAMLGHLSSVYRVNLKRYEKNSPASIGQAVQKSARAHF